MDIKNLLEHNVETVIDREGLEGKLKAGKKLRIKHGVDVTSPLLHLGHAVNYWKLREFQELGHKVIFLIGDFTTQIGDPTGKNKTRPEVSVKQIEKDAKEYLRQATKILINKPNLLEVRRNSEWYGKMKLQDFLGLAKKITHAQLIERDMFQKRIKEREKIHIHELLYPLLQGYDSVMVKSDMTIIGSDQLFNEMMGRQFQEIFGQAPQSIITTCITSGLDGKEKMSKSLGNFVAIIDSPRQKFGKIMSLPDNLVSSYLSVYTKLSSKEIDEIKSMSAMNSKIKLAFEIVKIYDGEEQADEAEKFFNETFRERKLPDNIPIVKFKDARLADILLNAKLVNSMSEYRRLVNSGAIEANGEVIRDPNYKPERDATIKVGKKKFLKISDK